MPQPKKTEYTPIFDEETKELSKVFEDYWNEDLGEWERRDITNRALQNQTFLNALLNRYYRDNPEARDFSPQGLEEDEARLREGRSGSWGQFTAGAREWSPAQLFGEGPDINPPQGMFQRAGRGMGEAFGLGATAASLFHPGGRLLRAARATFPTIGSAIQKAINVGTRPVPKVMKQFAINAVDDIRKNPVGFTVAEGGANVLSREGQALGEGKELFGMDAGTVLGLLGGVTGGIAASLPPTSYVTGVADNMLRGGRNIFGTIGDAWRDPKSFRDQATDKYQQTLDQEAHARLEAGTGTGKRIMQSGVNYDARGNPKSLNLDSSAVARVATDMQGRYAQRPMRPTRETYTRNPNLSNEEIDALYATDLDKWHAEEFRRMYVDGDPAKGLRQLDDPGDALMTVAEATANPDIIAQARFIIASRAHSPGVESAALANLDKRVNTLVANFLETPDIGNPGAKMSDIGEELDTALLTAQKELEHSRVFKGSADRSTQAARSVTASTDSILDHEDQLWKNFEEDPAAFAPRRINDMRDELNEMYDKLTDAKLLTWPHFMGHKKILRGKNGEAILKADGTPHEYWEGGAMESWSPAVQATTGVRVSPGARANIAKTEIRELHDYKSLLLSIMREKSGTPEAAMAGRISAIISKKIAAVEKNADIPSLTRASEFSLWKNQTLATNDLQKTLVKQPGSSIGPSAGAQPITFLELFNPVTGGDLMSRQSLDNLLEYSAMGRRVRVDPETGLIGRDASGNPVQGPDPGLVDAIGDLFLTKFAEASRGGKNHVILGDPTKVRKWIVKWGEVINHPSMKETREAINKYGALAKERKVIELVRDNMKNVWLDEGAGPGRRNMLGRLQNNIEEIKQLRGAEGLHIKDINEYIKDGFLMDRMFQGGPNGGLLRDDAFEIVRDDLRDPIRRALYAEVMEAGELKTFQEMIERSVGAQMAARKAPSGVAPGAQINPPYIERLMRAAKLGARVTGARVGGRMGQNMGGALQTASTMSGALEKTVTERLDFEYWQLWRVAMEHPEIYAALLTTDIDQLRQGLTTAELLGGIALKGLKGALRRRLVAAGAGTAQAMAPEEARELSQEEQVMADEYYKNNPPGSLPTASVPPQIPRRGTRRTQEVSRRRE